SDVLLKRLQRAARAGQVRFRALKIGKNKYQEIKPSYFRKRCHFKWSKNQIEHWVPYNNPEDPEYDRTLTVAWDDVHLDRKQFASLLKDMGVTVEHAVRAAASAVSDEPVLSKGEAGLHPKAKRGRKSLAAPIRQVVFDLMDYNGDLSDDDPVWSRQADV